MRHYITRCAVAAHKCASQRYTNMSVSYVAAGGGYGKGSARQTFDLQERSCGEIDTDQCKEMWRYAVRHLVKRIMATPL